MIIGIDIDDTICDTTLYALKCLAKFDNKVLDYHNLPLMQYEEFMRLYIDDIMINSPLKDGVKEAFDYLNSHGYKIYIITARNLKYSENTYKLTEDYLKRYCLKYDQIIFDRSDKGFDANNVGAKFFVDDKEMVLDGVFKYGIECIRLTKDKNSKYKTYVNWYDIIDYLKTKEG